MHVNKKWKERGKHCSVHADSEFLSMQKKQKQKKNKTKKKQRVECAFNGLSKIIQDQGMEGWRTHCCTLKTWEMKFRSFILDLRALKLAGCYSFCKHLEFSCVSREIQFSWHILRSGPEHIVSCHSLWGNSPRRDARRWFAVYTHTNTVIFQRPNAG